MMSVFITAAVDAGIVAAAAVVAAAVLIQQSLQQLFRENRVN